MKKIIYGLLIVTLMIIANVSVVMARGIGEFEGQDVAVTRMHQGYVGVVPMDSVYVKLYDPPVYLIGMTSYTVDTNTEQIKYTKALTVKYNYSTKEIYVYDDSRGGSWSKDTSWGQGFEKGREGYYNKIFFKCYNIPFF